ncbi:MAG: epoxyqueuosine reductase QueH [Nitrospirae bacterium]|nr:epoxyqueuosine reductase QueH [Nitrospirota bacterium]
MKILFHICCSNCAVYPVKLTRAEGHDFTGFWYNPNIHPPEEYQLRLDSLKKLSDDWRINMLYLDEYRPEDFFDMLSIKSPLPVAMLRSNGNPAPLFKRRELFPPLSKGDEGGFSSMTPTFPERCKSCYSLRLERTAATASKEGFDAFSTTLLISPYQDFDQISITGKLLAEKYKISFYLKDFRPHFRESKCLAKELSLYRQRYCGCIFSKLEREQAIKERELKKFHG